MSQRREGRNRQLSQELCEQWVWLEVTIVKEATNKTIENVGRDTIEVKQFSDNFKLDVKVFIAGTEFKNSM